MNTTSGPNGNSRNNRIKRDILVAATMGAIAVALLLLSSSINTIVGFAKAQQQTNTPPVLTVPTSPLALGASIGSSSGTLPIILASHVTASDKEDGSLSSQIQCYSKTNNLRPATNTFSFPAGTTTVTCSVTDNGIRDENNQQRPGTMLTVYKRFTVTVTSPDRDEDNNRLAKNDVDSTIASNVGGLDIIAPETRIVASSVQNNGLTNLRTVIFTVGGSDSVGIAGYQCSIDKKPIDACENSVSFSGLGDGSHSFTAAAIDKEGNKDSTPEQIVWEIDSTAPVISGLPILDKLPVIATDSTGGKLPVIATDSAGGEIKYTPPTAADARDGALKVTCNPASGSTIASGVGKTGTGVCTASDLAGNKATRTFDYKVIWPTTTFPISPIKTVDGTTKFILGSTIPVKFKVDSVPGFGYITDIKARMLYAKIDNVIPSGGTIVQGTISAATSGNEFRYTTDGEYVFNLGTKSITAGQGIYQITVDFGDGSKKSLQISLINPPKKQ